MARKNEFIDKIDGFIGNKIYMLRLSNGLSRQQLADVVGVTHQQLQKYEKGTNRICAGRLLLISNALKKDISFFYEGLNNNSEQNEISRKQRLCIEVSRNFMKLNNPEHQSAVNTLIKTLAKETA